MIRYLSHYKIKENDVVFDLGGFWGDFSKEALSKLGDKGKLVIIEPSPWACALLNGIVDTARGKAILIQAGLGSKNGCADISLRSNGLFSSYREEPVDKRFEFPSTVYKQTTPIFTIDFIVKILGITKIDFLKCNIEGDEIKVFSKNAKIFNILQNGCIASNHEVDGEKTYHKLSKIFTKKGFHVVVENVGEEEALYFYRR